MEMEKGAAEKTFLFANDKSSEYTWSPKMGTRCQKRVVTGTHARDTSKPFVDVHLHRVAIWRKNAGPIMTGGVFHFCLR